MSIGDLQSQTGVRCIRTVSATTTVVEYMDGTVAPADPMVCKMWGLLGGPVVGPGEVF